MLLRSYLDYREIWNSHQRPSTACAVTLMTRQINIKMKQKNNNNNDAIIKDEKLSINRVGHVK